MPPLSGLDSLKPAQTAREAILLIMNQNSLDPTVRALLQIQMLIVEEIGEKLDTIFRDEKGLREAVLNGWEQSHHEHHAWIARQIGEEKEAEELARDQIKSVHKAAVEAAVRWGIPLMMTAIAGFTAWASKG